MTPKRYTGIGLMMATTLENNGAVVYILGRRLHVLEKAATENAVRFSPAKPLHFRADLRNIS